MLRAINPTHRPAPVQAHRARADMPEIMSSPDEYYREEYIEFINTLMHRMKVDALHRMVHYAVDTIDAEEG